MSAPLYRATYEGWQLQAKVTAFAEDSVCVTEVGWPTPRLARMYGHLTRNNTTGRLTCFLWHGAGIDDLQHAIGYLRWVARGGPEVESAPWRPGDPEFAHQGERELLEVGRPIDERRAFEAIVSALAEMEHTMPIETSA